MSDVEPVIRPLEERDAEAIPAFLQDSWSHNPTMLALYQEMHRAWRSDSLIRQTLVAEVEGDVVGAGTLFESTIHPHMLSVTLNVARQWQRRGIGSRLWAALEALGDGRPWLAKATLLDKAGISFLRKRGLKPLLRTLTGVLDPAQPAVQHWLASLPAEVPGYRSASIAQSPAPPEVALIHAAIYRQAHEWNPPVEESLEAARAHYCGPNRIADSQLCVYRGDQLVGAANLIANPFQPSAGEAYLVNIGVVDLPPDEADPLTRLLIRRSLEIAAERCLSVRFEADDTHQLFQSCVIDAPAAEVDHDFVLVANGQSIAPESADSANKDG